MKTVFLRILDASEKATVLSDCARGLSSKRRFVVDERDLKAIPRSPFAYWLSKGHRALFDLPSLEEGGTLVKQGMATSDDFRFLRCAWEVAPDNIAGTWRPFAKGGSFSPYYSDLSLLARWEDATPLAATEAKELKAFVETTSGTNHWSRRIPSVEYYGRPGLTYPRRLRRLAVSPLPEGSLISVRGSGIYAKRVDLPAIAGLMSSATFDFLVKCSLGRSTDPQFDNGTLALTPAPALSSRDRERLGGLAMQAIRIRRRRYTAVETAHVFVLPAVLQVGSSSFGQRVDAWQDHITAEHAHLSQLQAEIDETCLEIYGVHEDDRPAIVDGSVVADDEPDRGDAGEVSRDADATANPSELAADLLSWAVGVAAGRFDMRLASGERPWPEECDPFDPLPACSPGILVAKDGFPSLSAPPGYPIQLSPWLVHDAGHPFDISLRVREVFDMVFGATSDQSWAEVGDALGTRGDDVTDWLRKGFFEHHLARHSIHKRKAPVMWPMGTVSGSYLIWLYAHRATSDSLFQVLNDIVDPKVGLEQRRLNELTQEAGPNPSASQHKAIYSQETLVGELHELRDRLEAVAPLWAPCLNDGIVIVLAPLWRLFAHHRPWSKELKKHWDKLAAGDYDWAQLAMRLWPERVIPKCAEDRSLAIAHGLEDVFWVQDADNTDKWRPRTTPTTPVDQLVADRHNPATKAALQQAGT